MDHYLKPILEHKNLVIAATAVTGLFAVAAFVLLPPSYRSTASVLLTPISGNPLTAFESDTDVDMATELLISTSKAVVGRVADDLAAQSIAIGVDELADNVSAGSPRESKVLDLTYRATTPELAQTIANSFAENYLEYREQIATENRAEAVDVLDERVALLKEQLSQIEGRLTRMEAGTQSYVSLSVERDSVDGELLAQQEALAALSTLSLSAGEILSPARLPTAATGPGLIPMVTGGLAGGFVIGVVLAMLLSAVKASQAPRNRRASDHIEHNRRKEDRLNPGGRRETDRPSESAVERLARVTAGRNDGEAAADSQTPPTSQPADRPAGDDAVADRTPDQRVPARSERNEPPIDDPVTAHFGANVPPPPRNKAKLADRRKPPGPAATSERHSNGAAGEPPLYPLASNLDAEADSGRLVERIRRQVASGPLTCLAIGQDDRAQSLAAGFALVDGLGNLGIDVLIIDAVLDEPVLAKVLGLSNAVGLSELLVEEVPLESTVQQLEEFDRLYVITTGNPAALTPSTTGARLRDVLRKAKQRFPVTVIIGGDLTDAAVLTRTEGGIDGLVVATSAPPGTPADDAVIEKLSNLGTPVWIRLSFDGGTDSTSAAATAPTTV